jgi:HAD superfamily hydrolase (TIGR01509 family)
MIKGVIWDMDGVISDTQHIHATVESRLLQRYDILLSPEEITRRFAGVRPSEFLTALLKEKGHSNVDISRLITEKWQLMQETAEAEVTPIPGTVELVRALHKAGIKQAVASASLKQYVTTVLRRLDVYDLFDAVVTGDQVQKGKPDPMIFLTAAKRISISPHECIVIEDGYTGMLAAKRAAMTCIGLIDENDHREYPADYRIPCMKFLDVAVIQSADESSSKLHKWLNKHKG